MEEKIRCGWCVGDKLYEDYHDNEWGVPVRDDASLFEFLTLETFQAGLSWITVLRKRENFRLAFDNFDYRKIADYSEEKQLELMQNSGIIRNGAKIRAAISNATAYMAIQKEFGSFSQYIWSFVNNEPIQNNREDLKQVPATTVEAEALSKDLKKRGFKFVGPTVVYAHMQATGMVNDHITECFRHSEVKNL
ncbi:DNA-3-methyladenine glycosylase I [Salinimicrobium oceani]|uniref:DNA-3-methyladenine glycosylase I n=1 Tax=Salinimicrobium oceani TaxID=2722702 RepID=A0ABX1CXK7_9FLAO|nr:DNA-3-methyladenine glycosylase I [Salinimicrobium oceani]NJW53001.1 DNA-3-methyladenine glycosylase I [Salinimicrobium oceani]